MIIIPKPGPPTLPTKLVLGTDQNSAGVTGQSNFGPGVLGQSTGGYSSLANEALDIVSPGTDGVLGEGTNGVRGVSGAEYGDGPAPGGAGVWGTNTNSGPGVYGTSAMGDGVLGSAYHGVHGIFPAGPSGGAGVWGEDKSSAAGGVGVAGTTTNGVGVSGISGSAQSAGVSGVNTSGSTTGGPGVSGSSAGWNGVQGVSGSSQHAGVAGTNTGGGYGVWASGNPAGHFSGDVQVTGNVSVAGTLTAQVDVLLGSDCAEDFDIVSCTEIDPGTVMVLTENGALQPSQDAYDKKVAGVISGAGDYKPGLILGRRESSEERKPLALVGKVFCKVDADPAPIAVGDLLTTASRPGFGMKATDSSRAFGAVIGKALKPLQAGQGMIPILVALQ